MKLSLSSGLAILLAGITFTGCDDGFLSGKCSKEDTAYTLGYQAGKKETVEQKWMINDPLAISGASQGACNVIVHNDTQAEALFPICTQAFLEGFANKNPQIDLCPEDKCNHLMDRLPGMK